MNKKFDYKMVIFDVDGTILDTSKGLWPQFNILLVIIV